MKKTVFAISEEFDGNFVHYVAAIPTGDLISIEAISKSSNTAVHFKAPSYDLLEVIDSFLRNTFN